MTDSEFIDFLTKLADEHGVQDWRFAGDPLSRSFKVQFRFFPGEEHDVEFNFTNRQTAFEAMASRIEAAVLRAKQPRVLVEHERMEPSLYGFVVGYREWQVREYEGKPVLAPVGINVSQRTLWKGTDWQRAICAMNQDHAAPAPSAGLEGAATCHCFAGDVVLLTANGPRTFRETVGTNQRVLTRAGFVDAEIKAFGRQQLQRTVLSPVRYRTQRHTRRRFPSAGGGSVHHEVLVTPDHEWILADGSTTRALVPGDVVPAVRAIPDRDSDEYMAGYRHGMVFGDGYVSEQCADKFVHHVQLFGRAGDEAWRFEKLYRFPSRVKAFKTYGGTGVVVAERSLKEVPEDATGDYLAGFADGWICADGDIRPNDAWRLRSINHEALDWLEARAALAGYSVVGRGEESNDRTNYGRRTRRLRWLCLRTDLTGWIVRSVEPDVEDDVYCAVVPGVGEFALQGGIITHNCGWNAFHSVNGRLWRSRLHMGTLLRVYGAILAKGRIEVHGDGFRAEWAKPLCLGYTANNHAQTAHLAAQLKLPHMPLGELPAYAREHGQEVPEELRPTAF